MTAQGTEIVYFDKFNFLDMIIILLLQLVPLLSRFDRESRNFTQPGLVEYLFGE